jgi:ArsR family transcriptional regulator, arsenate/arsenite/antimonite-responsive transcriptional repressor
MVRVRLPTALTFFDIVASVHVMARDLVVVERKLGDRCCDRDARPTVTTRDAQRFADDLALLANPVRIQLLDVLSRNEGRVCVCDLEAAVPVKQPTVSHHLRVLRDAGLIESERQGLWAFYRIRREKVATLRDRIARRLEDFA